MNEFPNKLFSFLIGMKCFYWDDNSNNPVLFIDNILQNSKTIPTLFPFLSLVPAADLLTYHAADGLVQLWASRTAVQ